MMAATAVAMTVTPVMAANPTAKLSVASKTVRASAKEGEAKLAGTGLIIALVVAAIVAVVVIADNDDPGSP